MAVHRVLSDIRRIAGGSAAFVKYLLTDESVDIGLGQLSADSTAAVRGRPNRYLVSISNARTQSCDVTLVIDLYSADSPTHPGGHYAHFSKRLKARPRASTQVDVQYDWLEEAVFAVDDTSFRPDDLWRGTLDRRTRYSVSAVLLDASGRRLDLLTIYQELAS